MPPDPLVLAFDTSAAHCAAALLSGERVLEARREEMATGQAERLMPMLEEMLAAQGLTWRDLAVLGVGTGPGNFTGVRIAVAAARGLALGLGIPAVGVTTLQAMAHGQTGVTVVAMDARRGELYVQCLPGGEACLCTLDTLPPIPARAEPRCIGFQAEAIAPLVSGSVAEPKFPLSVAIARIAALRRFSAGRPAPFYLRGADAAPPSDPPPVILP